MLDNTERVERSGRQLEEGYKMCVETGKAGVNTNVELCGLGSVSLNFFMAYFTFQILHFTLINSHFTHLPFWASHFTFHVSHFKS